MKAMTPAITEKQVYGTVFIAEFDDWITRSKTRQILRSATCLGDTGSIFSKMSKRYKRFWAKNQENQERNHE